MTPDNPGLEVAKSFAEAAGKESVNSLAGLVRSMFPFWGLKKRAVDAYISEVERSNLSPDAKMCAIINVKKTYQELKNQSAIIDVAYSVLSCEQSGSTEALPSPDNELVSRLIDAGKFVSDENLQLLWGNVLAGEFEYPGKTPKSVVRVLSELSKENAVIFSNLCSLQVDLFADTGKELGYLGPEFMVAHVNTPYLKQMAVDEEKLRELEHLDLINFSGVGAYSRPISSSDWPYIHIASDEEVISIHNKNGKFPCGTVILTPVGECISRFVARRHSQEHMDAIKENLRQEGITISPTPGISLTKIKGETAEHAEFDWKRLWAEPPQAEA